jgi:hypothetical protein
VKFTKVVTKDWHGEIDEYQIISLKSRGKGKFSCTFKNSCGDIEKKLVELFIIEVL